MIENAVYVNGKIVVRYKDPVPKLMNINGNQYYFDCQHGVSLGFLDEKDVPAALNYRGGCCGKQQLVLSLASKTAYDHWTDGNGGR